MAPITVEEPFPIFNIAGRYMVFDVNTVTYLRREHHVIGVLTGNLPDAAQQNVFNSLPLLLMAEEARLLVEKRVAFVVDDAAEHMRFEKMTGEERRQYVELVRERGLQEAEYVKRRDDTKNAKHFEAREKSARKRKEKSTDPESMFDFGDSESPSTTPKTTPPKSSKAVIPFALTPTSSYPPLTPPSPDFSITPNAPPSYPLFKLLHSQGYFMMPGLRFGCQYSAYPGDPLRFHSHFLAVCKGWNEPLDLLDLVAGGRLGTSVKKGYLLGGLVEGDGKEEEEKVRTFSFEWAAM